MIRADVNTLHYYYPFGQEMPGRSFNSNSYSYGFNGFLKDDEIKGSGNSYDMGERLYDPRIGRTPTPDPLMSQNATWSPYVFALNNPIVFVDENGEWPGVTFMFFELDVGLGLGYGLNYIRQEGIAWDEVGKTHFTLVSAVYIVNQNLEEGSSHPQFVLGASIGLSAGITQNWSANTFREATESYSAAASTGKPSVKAKFGIGIEGSENSFTLSGGLQAGFKFTRLNTSVEFGISLTDKEASVVNDATDVISESWILNNQRQIKDDNGNVTGFSGTVATRNTKGELIDTGIEVFSGTTTNEDGTVQSNGSYSSKNYQSEATKAEDK